MSCRSIHSRWICCSAQGSCCPSRSLQIQLLHRCFPQMRLPCLRRIRSSCRRHPYNPNRWYLRPEYLCPGCRRDRLPHRMLLRMLQMQLHYQRFLRCHLSLCCHRRSWKRSFLLPGPWQVFFSYYLSFAFALSYDNILAICHDKVKRNSWFRVMRDTAVRWNLLEERHQNGWKKYSFR